LLLKPTPHILLRHPVFLHIRTPIQRMIRSILRNTADALQSCSMGTLALPLLLSIRTSSSPVCCCLCMYYSISSNTGLPNLPTVVAIFSRFL
jgi:hypothetical protein